MCTKYQLVEKGFKFRRFFVRNLIRTEYFGVDGSFYMNIRRTDAEGLRKLRRNELNGVFSFSEFDVCAQ